MIVSMGVAALAAASGCNRGGGGTYQPKQVTEAKVEAIDENLGEGIWPMAVGNQWTYEVEVGQNLAGQTSQRKFELTFRVSKIENVGDGKRVSIETWEGATRPDKPTMQLWAVTPRFIGQVWVGDSTKAYSPPQPAIMFPLKAGEEMKYKGTGPTPVGVQGPQEIELKLLPAQLVDTGMGRVTAIPVESGGKWSGTIQQNGKPLKIDGSIRSMSFFAPKIGLVRFRQETSFPNGAGTQTLRLKSHTIKG